MFLIIILYILMPLILKLNFSSNLQVEVLTEISILSMFTELFNKNFHPILIIL